MPNRPGKILVADDDSAIVDALCLLLEDEGYDVKTTIDGECLDHLEDDCPDLLLLDIWMSGRNGGEVCRELRRKRETKQLPIIMISANRDTEAIAKNSGADDFLTKPFDIDDLLQKIDKYMEKN